MSTKQQERKKLDEKEEICVFVGYSKHMKVYKFFNPVTNKVFFSRDVKFDETMACDWKDRKRRNRSSA